MNTDIQKSANPSSNPPVATARPTIAAVVSHRVEDYDAWKAAFDRHAEARRAAGIIRHHINRSVDDPNQLSVYLAGTDRAKLEAFFASDDLRATMSKAGVQGPPTIAMIKPVEDRTDKRDPLYGMIAIHRVADFDAWKKVYDEVDRLRTDGRVVGHAVNRSADDPNLVVVFHQAETLEALQAFAGSAELKGAMGRAGVTGAPSFSFFVGAGWGDC